MMFHELTIQTSIYNDTIKHLICFCLQTGNVPLSWSDYQTDNVTHPDQLSVTS